MSHATVERGTFTFQVLEVSGRGRLAELAHSQADSYGLSPAVPARTPLPHTCAQLHSGIIPAQDLSPPRTALCNSVWLRCAAQSRLSWRWQGGIPLFPGHGSYADMALATRPRCGQHAPAGSSGGEPRGRHTRPVLADLEGAMKAQDVTPRGPSTSSCRLAWGGRIATSTKFMHAALGYA
jgi:hypothetical protein